jgi:hypothetical protein
MTPRAQLMPPGKCKVIICVINKSTRVNIEWHFQNRLSFKEGITQGYGLSSNFFSISLHFASLCLLTSLIDV